MANKNSRNFEAILKNSFSDLIFSFFWVLNPIAKRAYFIQTFSLNVGIHFMVFPALLIWMLCAITAYQQWAYFHKHSSICLRIQNNFLKLSVYFSKKTKKEWKKLLKLEFLKF